MALNSGHFSVPKHHLVAILVFLEVISKIMVPYISSFLSLVLFIVFSLYFSVLYFGLFPHIIQKSSLQWCLTWYLIHTFSLLLFALFVIRFKQPHWGIIYIPQNGCILSIWFGSILTNVLIHVTITPKFPPACLLAVYLSLCLQQAKCLLSVIVDQFFSI